MALPRRAVQTTSAYAQTRSVNRVSRLIALTATATPLQARGLAGHVPRGQLPARATVAEWAFGLRRLGTPETVIELALNVVPVAHEYRPRIGLPDPVAQGKKVAALPVDFHRAVAPRVITKREEAVALFISQGSLHALQQAVPQGRPPLCRTPCERPSRVQVRNVHETLPGAMLWNRREIVSAPLSRRPLGFGRSTLAGRRGRCLPRQLLAVTGSRGLASRTRAGCDPGCGCRRTMAGRRDRHFLRQVCAMISGCRRMLAGQRIHRRLRHLHAGIGSRVLADTARWGRTPGCICAFARHSTKHEHDATDCHH
mmetsp:Transcript_14044/g.42268  ORF Transcript_14044/g.42268 Transcript_14044/m.42268 type:complete len:312 (-) Transcript_14044:67-1002(-)